VHKPIVVRLFGFLDLAEDYRVMGRVAPLTAPFLRAGNFLAAFKPLQFVPGSPVFAVGLVEVHLIKARVANDGLRETSYR